jgi:tRNA-specific 2-thiouridylase
LPLRCTVQVRYRGTPAPAEVRRVGEAVHVFFDEPQRAVVPGQFAVFYGGERALGGGMIRAALRAQRVDSPALAAESSA